MARGSGLRGKKSQNSIILILPHCHFTPLPVVLLARGSMCSPHGLLWLQEQDAGVSHSHANLTHCTTKCLGSNSGWSDFLGEERCSQSKRLEKCLCLFVWCFWLSFFPPPHLWLLFPLATWWNIDHLLTIYPRSMRKAFLFLFSISSQDHPFTCGFKPTRRWDTTFVGKTERS